MWQPREMRTEHATCSKCHKNIDTSFTRPAQEKDKQQQQRVARGGADKGREREREGRAERKGELRIH